MAFFKTYNAMHLEKEKEGKNTQTQKNNEDDEKHSKRNALMHSCQ
jgi:hypothetical protein